MTPIPAIHYPSLAMHANKERKLHFDPAKVKLALLAILLLLLGTAIAILGPKVGGAPVVVGGVAIIVLGARLLRPISHGILKWLDDKNA